MLNDIEFTPSVPVIPRPASAGVGPTHSLWHSQTPLGLQRQKTTYGHMNEWHRMKQAGGVPVTLSDGNWNNPQQARVSSTIHNDLQFGKAYADLTSQVAYRYPNPGVPRVRQGRIGGSWRHIKEVLGHGGSRVVYVDGLISIYDQENFNQSLHAQSPSRPHIKKNMFGPGSNRIGVKWPETPGEGVQLPNIAETVQYKHVDPDVARKLGLQTSDKYKGFYRYK